MSGNGLGALLASCAIVWAASAAAVPANFKADADAVLQQFYPADGPGAAAIVTEKGKVVWQGASGVADVTGKRKITPDTVFRLGSITKQFTAAMILQLAEEGKLGLDDPLSKFVPDYPGPGAKATIRQLLNHTSGIASYTGLPGWMTEANTSRPITTQQLIDLTKDKPLDFEPGTKFSYNNSGYVLLGAIIEKIDGRPWHQSLEQRITKPLGLSSIRYGVDEDKVAGMAVGYAVADGQTKPGQKIDMSVPHAAGALLGTVGDLARWNAALHGGKVVKSDSYRQMIAPTKLSDGSTNPYAFGLGNSKVRDRPAIGHGGGIFGFVTDSVYVPSQGLFVAVFHNAAPPVAAPSAPMERIAALALGDPYPNFTKQPVDLKAVEPFLGAYKLPEGERVFFSRDGKLFTRRTGSSEMEVFAAGEGRYFYGPTSLTWFAVTRSAAGEPAMDFYANGAKQSERIVRTGPVPTEAAAVTVAPEALRRHLGDYALGEATLTIAMGPEGRLTGQLTGQQPLPLIPASANEFRTQGVDAKLVFEGEGPQSSAVTLLQGGRTMRAPRK